MKKFILAFILMFAVKSFVSAQYCVPTGALDCTDGDLATNVTFAGINNNSGCTGGYSDYSASVTPGNVLLGATVPMSVTVGDGGTEYVAVWIDYNHNNVFDASEYKLLGSGNNVTVSGTITIPGTALTGPTRMRVRVRFSAAPTNAQACDLPGTFGEVEDYTVNINSPVSCSGTPAPGNTLSTANPVCAGTSVTLSVQTATTGSGVTYQWQTSATGAAGTYAAILGATSATYTFSPTVTGFYRLAVTCGASTSTGFSNGLQLVVNPLPTVTVTPTSGCAPVTFTASGADTYTWTPTTGLTPTTGATVTANPAATTVYTVTGTITATGCKNTATATANAKPTASVLSSVASATLQINEGFDAAAGLPAGWSQTNRSNPLGASTWTNGTAANVLAPAYDGAPASFELVNFNSTTGTGTISNWLFTQTITIKNGDTYSFATRAATGGGAFPDRLQLRMSLNGASTNVGTTETSVGDFTILLQDVNPTLTATGYPEVWTVYTGTITGVTGTVTGKLGFRYFVTNGGPSGANSNIIGLDRVTYATPAAATCANTVSNLAVNITGGVGPYTVVYSNGTTNTTINNYTSGSAIQVSPSVSTTYTLVSVTGANGCVGTGNTGSAAITITPAAVITTPPAAQSACIGGNATFGVTPNTTNGTTYQYQVSTDGGVTYTNIPGATTQNYTLTGATAAMNGNLYRVIVTGACGGVITSAGVPLTVNAPATILAQPGATTIACAGNNATITVLASGNQLTYQWQVSTNGGTTFTNVANGANYSGATTNMLTIINVPTTFLNYQYRVLVSSGGCAAITSAVSTLTTINAAPVTVISVAPSNTVQPGTTVVLTAATSPATGTTYQWYRNGVPVAGATGNTLTVGVDGIGTYTVVATTANGCFSSASTPVNITIGTSASTVLFIYPSPNSGTFQVRYYNKTATALAPEGALLNVFDSKGSRVFTQQYGIIGGYTQMNVNLGSHGSGIYRVELSNSKGERIKTGSVLVY